MQSDLAMKMTADLFWTGLLLCLPVRGLAMVVGLAVSVLQAVMQLQDMSLSVIPKLLVAGAAVVAFGPWMLRILCGFTVRLWGQIPAML